MSKAAESFDVAPPSRLIAQLPFHASPDKGESKCSRSGKHEISQQ
jgi:hypothetical protein